MGRMVSSRVAPHPSHDEVQPLSWMDSFDVDRASREVIKESLKLPCIYSEVENKYLEAVTHMMSLYDDNSLPTTKFEMSSSLLSASTSTHVKDGHTITLGLSTCTIRTSIENIVAFDLDNMSKFKTLFAKGASSLVESTLEVVNPHHSVFYLLTKVPPPFHSREFVGSYISKRLSPNQYICVNHSTTHEKAPFSHNSVRAEMVTALRLTEKAPGVTKVESIFRLDLKRVTSLKSSRTLLPYQFPLGF